MVGLRVFIIIFMFLFVSLSYGFDQTLEEAPEINTVTVIPADLDNCFIIKIGGKNLRPDFKLNFNNQSIFLINSKFIDERNLEAEIFIPFHVIKDENEIKVIFTESKIAISKSFDLSNFFITEIAPNSGKINTQFKVLIKGGNFIEGLIPFSKEWGVSFVDITTKDTNTIEALALVDELAEPGKREIVVANPPDEYSNSITFTILNDSTLSTQMNSNRNNYKYGIYEDFNNGEHDGKYISSPTSQDRDRNLIWWSTGHNQTYPTLTQKDGLLEITTEYDEIRGYWLTFRLAEPEGPVANENSVIHIAKIMSADFYIPEPDVNWSHPAIGLTGRYKPPEYSQISWGFELRMRGDDKNNPNFWYCISKLYHTHAGDMRWEGEVVGSFDGGNINYGTWINLRYDLFKYGDSIWVIDMFVNNNLKVRMFPKDAKYILDELVWWRGPVRFLSAGKPYENGSFTYYLDNIKAIYPWPLIETSKKSLSFKTIEGIKENPSQKVKIRNKGVGILDYTWNAANDWISPSWNNGRSSGEWDEFTVTVDNSKMASGLHSGKILISGSGDQYRAGNTPQAIVVDVELEPSPILEPLDFAGKKVTNVSLSQREYINVLSWRSNPENRNIVKYQVYVLEASQQKYLKDMLVEIESNKFEYMHRDVEKDKRYNYAIVAVDSDGNSGRPAYISVG